MLEIDTNLTESLFTYVVYALIIYEIGRAPQHSYNPMHLDLVTKKI